MIQSIAYVREVLSLYTDRSDTGKSIYGKMKNGHYKSEEAFVRDLTEEEIKFLNQLLAEEIQHAENEQDSERVHHLNDIYELLF
ncbi:sigma-G-dependent sporulation-specific acid-soluble spore protein CsgA [Niallia taxi]|nr:sigma-G-dependent sporulation-specific acid-soluble spore protein CsgA [Niallia taxi]MDE5055881.1 sigma-G-dependent sporulation-specific acid-soluble spore protein CsgA [Niallia taxi]